MRQLLVIAATLAVVAAGGDRDVDAQLLARVAQILESNSGGSGFGGGSSFSSSGPSSSYGAPSSGPSSSYGAPTSFGGQSGFGGGAGGVSLGSPELAQRVGEFQLSNGGAGPSRSAASQQYGAPSGFSRGGFGGSRSAAGGVQLGSPERAQQVAEFELSGGSNGGATRNGGGGYQ